MDSTHPTVENVEPPLHRPLQAYAFDPSHGVSLGNHLTLQVPYEELTPGPTGARLQIIDYDATHQRYYRPVNLDEPRVLLERGVPPDESDPRFHQQMVYAVASRTLWSFEHALGRRLTFAGKDGGTPRERLRIFPHAMQAANAFYDRGLGALLFGYFAASAEEPGSNLPGQVVFTCLSHDIVVHEMTHALVDGLRTHFMDATSPDTPAFHEAFADLIALFQHFMQPEAVLGTLQRTAGELFQPELDPELQLDAPTADGEDNLRNPLVELARQFGESLGRRRALRSAIGRPPRREALAFILEPHERGAILVAAVFEAYFRAYVRRTRDLLEIAGFGGRSAIPRVLPPKLAGRMAEEAAKVARHFTRMCIRALDYCPPADVRFGDFLRALITADHGTVLEDRFDYRGALIEGFRRRGIYPEGAVSLSEESLLWKPPAGRPLSCDLFAEETSDGKKTTPEENVRNFAETHRNRLGLQPGDPIQVGTVRRVHRVNPDTMDTDEAIVEVIQEHNDQGVPYYGGITLVLDPASGRVRYSISRRIDPDQIPQRREFQQLMAESYGRSLYGGVAAASRRTNFQTLHRGY